MDRKEQPFIQAIFSKETCSYLCLLLLALAPRLALALVFLRSPISMDDMHQYDMLARSLIAGNGYRWYARADVETLQPYLEAYYGFTLPVDQVPVEGYRTVFRAPGYPFFLAGVYGASGLTHRFAAARLIQALMGASLAPLTALLALRLGLVRRTALLAGGIVALYPILIFYPLALASENLFILLLLAGTLLLLDAIERGRIATTVGAGLLLGLATLTRSTLIAFLPLGALALWRSGASPAPRGRSAGPRKAIVFSLVACLAIVPWAVRNSLVLGRPAFIENSLGYNLFVSYHPRGNGGFSFNVAGIPLRILEDDPRDRWAMEQAAGFIRADPARAALLVPRRLVYFWGLEDREMLFFYSSGIFGAIPQPWLGLAYLLLVLPLVLTALAAPFGFALTPRHRGLMLGLFAVGMLPHLLILAEPRFHLPLVPFLVPYAAAAWTQPGLTRRIRQGLRAREPVWMVASAAGLLLLAIWVTHLWWEWPQLSAAMGPGGHSLHLNWGN
jgi:4-amino-4-deoxy-L-arabinose transferase-like glycosyltransferase